MSCRHERSVGTGMPAAATAVRRGAVEAAVQAREGARVPRRHVRATIVARQHAPDRTILGAEPSGPPATPVAALSAPRAARVRADRIGHAPVPVGAPTGTRPPRRLVRSARVRRGGGPTPGRRRAMPTVRDPVVPTLGAVRTGRTLLPATGGRLGPAASRLQPTTPAGAAPTTAGVSGPTGSALGAPGPGDRVRAAAPGVGRTVLATSPASASNGPLVCRCRRRPTPCCWTGPYALNCVR